MMEPVYDCLSFIACSLSLLGISGISVGIIGLLVSELTWD